MRHLVAYGGLNAALFAGYHWLNPLPERTIDRMVTVEICVVSVLCVAIPLVWTRRWRALSVGLLGLFTGMAMLYYPSATDGTFLAIREHGIPAGANTTPPWWLHLARTLLATGAAYVAYWLVRWAHEHRHEAFPMLRDGAGVDDPFTGETA